jgi:hypothetical protein
MNDFPVIIIFLFVIAIIFAIVYGYIAAEKRRKELMLLAQRLGLSFSPDRNYTFAKAYGFLDKLDQGSNRYAFNIMHGMYHGHGVHVLEYHYETESRDSDGKRTTHSHYLSCFLLQLPLSFPELIIGPEGFFSKFAQMFGYDDIDFESAEFSRKFCVRSPDKKFAYDICHSRFMEYFLANDDLNFEIDRDTMAIVFDGQLSMFEIESNLGRLLELRSMIPEYLFNQR